MPLVALEKLETAADEHGIFTVSLARKAR